MRKNLTNNPIIPKNDYYNRKGKKTMTTTFMNTTAIPLYKFNGDSYCKMIDVIKLIHHEFYENNNKDFRRILDRMEMRVCKNGFILPHTKSQNVTFPGRYAVGYTDESETWHFFKESIDGKTIYTVRPCEAKLYKNYRDASACADFVDESADVLDWEDNLTEEERWQRELLMPFPYDADDGNENAIPVEVVR